MTRAVTNSFLTSNEFGLLLLGLITPCLIYWIVKEIRSLVKYGHLWEPISDEQYMKFFQYIFNKFDHK